MEFTNDEIIAISKFFNKMVLPESLVDLSERMKDFVSSLEAQALADAPVEPAPVETAPEVVAEVPVEAPVAPGDTVVLDENDIASNPVLADHGFVAGEEVEITEVIPA